MLGAEFKKKKKNINEFWNLHCFCLFASFYLCACILGVQEIFKQPIMPNNCSKEWSRNHVHVELSTLFCILPYAALPEILMPSVCLYFIFFYFFSFFFNCQLIVFLHSPKISLLQIKELNYFYNGGIRAPMSYFPLFRNHCRHNKMQAISDQYSYSEGSE